MHVYYREREYMHITERDNYEAVSVCLKTKSCVKVHNQSSALKAQVLVEYKWMLEAVF